MNLLILAGNLGTDPELRETSNGLAICNLSIATNERRKVQGEWKPHTEWHRVTVFGNQATTCSKNLTKGSYVVLHGRVSKQTYTDKENIERTSYEVIADRIEFGPRVPSSVQPTFEPRTPDDEIPF
tara:strand:- start:1368 stop:1745 length:378 start_codon:yes stop_codon:yes gene_type:complete